MYSHSFRCQVEGLHLTRPLRIGMGYNDWRLDQGGHSRCWRNSGWSCFERYTRLCSRGIIRLNGCGDRRHALIVRRHLRLDQLTPLGVPLQLFQLSLLQELLPRGRTVLIILILIINALATRCSAPLQRIIRGFSGGRTSPFDSLEQRHEEALSQVFGWITPDAFRCCNKLGES